MASSATTTIYTTPPGKVIRITHVVFRDPSASAAAATSVAVTSFRSGFSLANLVTAGTGYLIVQATDLAQFTEIAVSTAVQVIVTTGAAGVTCAVDIFGYQT